MATLLVLAQIPPGRSVLRLAGLVKTPAGYSALYFTNPDALPAVLPSKHARLTVSFAVHNASPDTAHYRWTMQLVQGQTTRNVATGQVTVDGNDTRQEHRVVQTSCSQGDLAVVIRLAAPTESIDFRAACSA